MKFMGRFKFLGLLFTGATAALIFAVVYLNQPPDDGRRPAERKHIADAAFNADK